MLMVIKTSAWIAKVKRNCYYPFLHQLLLSVLLQLCFFWSFYSLERKGHRKVSSRIDKNSVLWELIKYIMCDLNLPAQHPTMMANKRSFTYEEVTIMTNNFGRNIGEGGFGAVYLGNLNSDEQVAVKVLSQSSAQGYKQFKAEVYSHHT